MSKRIGALTNVLMAGAGLETEIGTGAGAGLETETGPGTGAGACLETGTGTGAGAGLETGPGIAVGAPLRIGGARRRNTRTAVALKEDGIVTGLESTREVNLVYDPI